MQWRWPGKRRWKQAGDLREVRAIALLKRRSAPPLVEIRDGPGDHGTWLLAVPERSKAAGRGKGTTAKRLLRSRGEG
jgi:hypothetical protein